MAIVAPDLNKSKKQLQAPSTLCQTLYSTQKQTDMHSRCIRSSIKTAQKPKHRPITRLPSSYTSKTYKAT